jgi:tetratricopeptide (TPR) repeat protein
MRYSPRMRWYAVVVMVLLTAGCTSMWEKHQTRRAEAEARGDYLKAVSEQRWLIDNAFVFGPYEEHSPEADARRYRHLAQLAAKTGNYRMALDSLRQALNTDPTQAAAIQRQLDALPLSPAERARVNREFAWNIAALQPGDNDLAPAVDENACWSYRAREIRIRRQRTVTTEDGAQQQITYDARTWIFDSDRQLWRAAGEWMEDAGTETELVNGPQQPRYRALSSPAGRFYVDGKVPPCHRDAWQGPFDLTRGTIFVAAQLPAPPPPSH